MKKKDWAFVFVSDSVRKTEKKIRSYNRVLNTVVGQIGRSERTYEERLIRT